MSLTRCGRCDEFLRGDSCRCKLHTVFHGDCDCDCDGHEVWAITEELAVEKAAKLLNSDHDYVGEELYLRVGESNYTVLFEPVINYSITKTKGGKDVPS